MLIVLLILGTTIAPERLSFQESCLADKRLRFRNLNPYVLWAMSQSSIRPGQ